MIRREKNLVLLRVSVRFESVARVRVMVVDCIFIYHFKEIFLLFCVLEYSIYFLEYSVNSVF